MHNFFQFFRSSQSDDIRVFENNPILAEAY